MAGRGKRLRVVIEGMGLSFVVPIPWAIARKLFGATLIGVSSRFFNGILASMDEVDKAN